MRLLTWFLASAALLLGCLSLLLAVGLVRGVITGAFDDGAGMAILIFQSRGAIISAAALVLGGAAVFSARANAAASKAGQRAALRAGYLGLGLGALSMLLTAGIALQ